MFVLQTGSMIVIARLLSPEDFGLQGMVVAMTGFLTMFRDGGLSVASVQQEGLTHEQTSTLFWINVAVGVVLTVAAVAMAPVLVTFYKEPRLFWVDRDLCDFQSTAWPFSTVLFSTARCGS